MDPATAARALENLREAFRQGADAYVEDHTINGSDWGHLLPRLTRPTRIWQGDDDNNVPAEATRWLAERIPGAELTILTGAGHGLTDEVWPEIYGWLLGFAPPPGPTTVEPVRVGQVAPTGSTPPPLPRRGPRPQPDRGGPARTLRAGGCRCRPGARPCRR